MRRALLAGAVALLLALPAAALGYGTTTTYASTSAGTPPGTWAGVAGAGSASDADAAATLTETDAGGIAASLYPSNRTMATGSNWTATDSGALLCSVSSAFDGSAGNPAGSLHTSYATLLNLGNLLAACSSTWDSDSFTWSSGAPAQVAYTMDRAVDLNGLVGVASATVTASLVDETVPGTVTLATATMTSDSGWAAMAATPSPGVVVSGHTYHLSISIAFSSTLSLVSGMGVGIDNVALSVTPADDRADGELRASGVPVGSTNTLELRARTSAEPFDVQVWDGAAWATRATVSTAAPSWQLVSYGLTPAERNGGTVRVRFRDTGSGPDATADVLGVEYMRVVSTGGVTVSGPATVTMPAVVLEGLAPQVSTTPMGTVEVVDTGGAASGWSLTATATRWALDGDPADRLPATAFTAAPAAPTTPDGSDMTGVAAGAGGAFDAVTPITLMSAAAAGGVGTYREDPSLSLTVPVAATAGVFRSVITLSVS